MTRYIKSSKENVTGKHPLDVLFPDMGSWFEEDVCQDLGSILNIDPDELRILIAKNAGITVDDPWDYAVNVNDVYDFFNSHKSYLEKLNDYINLNQDLIEIDY